MFRKLCRLVDVPPDSGLGLRVEGPGGSRHIVLFKTTAGVRAYQDACPHQGRGLAFAPGEYLLDDRGNLICPHHGASFDLTSGACFSGPCEGDRLSAIETRIEEGWVYLEASD